ncbi:MAG: flagellar hook protein FlgE [Acidobacteria bacterium]|nr:flagellar hook protein FlgE [Acidobacteriota bacterium]
MTALSGLNANAAAIDIVGGNLANLSTTGYKASSASFRDVVAGSLGTGSQSVMGVGAVNAMRQFTQGATQLTSAPLDAAIQGDGFFIVKSAGGAQLYSRAGNFRLDAAGILLTASGERVQGWVDAAGSPNVNSPVGDIGIPVGAMKIPQTTSTFSVDLNLNAQAPKDTKFSTSLEIYDSLGAPHTVTIAYTKTNPNTWSYSISVPDADLKGAFTPVAGDLVFDASGNLDSATKAPSTVSVKGFANGAKDQDLAFEIFNGKAGRVTQYAAVSAVSANAQSGGGVASMLSVGVADGGKIVAQYSDGKTRTIGQLAIASFRNPDTLVSMGDNNFRVGAGTSAPVVGLPESGGRGKVVGGALEASTVDIAREFTNLIVYQRGYQANSKVITTMDELTQQTVNLIR